MRFLATVDQKAKGYTMCFTMPGTFRHMSNALVKSSWITLCNRFTAKAAKDPVFRRAGYFWKQELQRRGALHFHTLFYGISSKEARTIQKWMARQWNLLVTGTLDPEERAKHLRWHLHRDNMAEVENIQGYFAKYLGKAEEEMVLDDPVPGGWWGAVNRKAIPWAECSELVLLPKVAVIAQRVARKIRQKRADNAKHRAICKKLGMVDFDGNPLASQFDLLRGNNSFMGMAVKYASARHTDSQGKPAPLRPGRFKLPDACKYSGVKLVGVDAPALALRIMRYAGERFRHHLETHPF